MPAAAPKFHFPETLACAAIVNRMGVPTALIFYDVGLDPKTMAKCVVVVVRGLVGREEARFAMDLVGEGDVTHRLSLDITAWNQLSQEAREAHMQASEVRGRAVSISVTLAVKGLLPTQQVPKAKA